MSLVRLCAKADVPEGSLKFAKVAGKDFVVANVGGEFYAMENWCTHEQGDLSQGELKNSVLTCPDHGAQFDVKTGKVLMGPDGEKPDVIQPERTYKVSVQGDDILVEIT